MNNFCKRISRIFFGEKQLSWGQGLVEYALILVLVAAGSALALAAVGTDVSDVFDRIVGSISAAEEDLPPGTIEVSVFNSEGNAVANTYVYAFDDKGNWTGTSKRTNSEGIALFEDMKGGTYEFLVYKNSYYYWSNIITFPKQSRATIKMNVQKFMVSVVDGKDKGIKNIYVYAYTANERYWLGVSGRTNKDGQVTLDVPDGDYKFRAYYGGHWYWSPQVNSPDQNEVTIDIQEHDMTVTVVDDNGEGVEQKNLYVYGYTEYGSYTGVYGRTNSNGRVKLTVPAGTYKFRVYFRAANYWSELVSAPGDDEIVIKTEERPFTVQVVDDEGKPVKNVRVHAFSGNLVYFGMHGKTNKDGEIVFELPRGNFKFRADYKGQSYWSSIVSTTVGNDTTITLD